MVPKNDKIMEKQTAKEKIKKLIEKYETEKTAGKVSQYTEAETKTGFIEPLFQSLGWNTQDRNEVGLETNISGGRVDYSFKLGSIVKFFVEAKPFRADLHKPEYVEQTINYAWHKGVVWAVLTDFESIKVFNAEVKTKHIFESLLFEIPYNEYLIKFDQLFLLSKESIASGLLDKEAEKWGKKIKKQSVSKQILDDLLKARKKLTGNISKHSKLNKISETELDEAVQRILDRLIFIRTCEDRGIEQKHLLSAVRDRRQILNNELKKIFREFDDAYNSKLFEPHFCDDLTIDDDVLKEVIESLYQTQDGNIHYDFNAINADVLGNIYEQYLGHILKKTSTTAKLKETHQHRKEQGIYYTPTYIVDYIVKNTVGEILKTAKPKTVQKLKILDPACGSGSFLIRAFDELVKYWAGELGGVRKPEILQNNIYGVDIDKQAVEITQMNLLLKTLYTRERLPMLKNIRCGNSLIDDPKIAGAKAFNWDEEFPDVIASEVPRLSLRRSETTEAISSAQNKLREESQGGFDVIIGNPPYVRPEKVAKNERNYYLTSGQFDKIFGRFDLYILFIEKALKLLKQDGYFSFIIPTSFFNQNYSKDLRKWILEDFEVRRILDLSDTKVFESSTVQNSIIVIRKKSTSKKNKTIIERPKTLSEFEKVKSYISQQIFLQIPQNMIRTDINESSLSVIEKTKSKSINFSGICYVVIGAVPHDSKTGASKDRLISSSKTNNTQKKYLEGKDIERYIINWRKIYIDYLPEEMHRPKFPELFENNKLVIRNISTQKGLLAVIDEEKYYANDTVSLCVPWYLLKFVKERGTHGTEEQIENSEKYNIKYLLSLVNSKLLNFYFLKILSSTLHVYPEAIRNLPICKIDFSNPKEKKKHDDLVNLVDKMLDLNKQLQKFGDKITDERKRIESEIQKTDNQIDELVYKLYGLTAEEIKIVEEK